jgi:hypothetical protein
MQITIEIEETTAALIWANEWGDHENLTPAEAIVRALTRIADTVPDNPAFSVGKMRHAIERRAAARRQDPIGLDLRVMRRDQIKLATIETI